MKYEELHPHESENIHLGGRPVDVENDIVNFYYSKFEKMILSNLQIVEALLYVSIYIIIYVT